MKTVKFTLTIFLFGLFSSVNGQTKGYFINDIFSAELKGQVKSNTEFIISSFDTLCIYNFCYSKSGIRSSQYSQSTHPEMGFKNDSTCFKINGKEVKSFNCKTNSNTDMLMTIGNNGLIIEIDVKYPDEEIRYIPYYNDSNRLTSLYTGRAKNKTFQFFATLIYTFNEDGSIKRTSAQGGNQPQGETEYVYDSKKMLIKTIRTGFDGNKSFLNKL